MADSNNTSNAVVLPVDNSEHSERAFKCMYVFVTLSFHFDETTVGQFKGQRHKVQYEGPKEGCLALNLVPVARCSFQAKTRILVSTVVNMKPNAFRQRQCKRHTFISKGRRLAFVVVGKPNYCGPVHLSELQASHSYNSRHQDTPAGLDVLLARIALALGFACSFVILSNIDHLIKPSFLRTIIDIVNLSNLNRACDVYRQIMPLAASPML